MNSPRSVHARLLMCHPSPDLYGSDLVFVDAVRGFTQAGARVHVTMPLDGPLTPLLRKAGAAVHITPTVVLRRSYLSPRGALNLVSDGTRALTHGASLLAQIQPDAVFVNTVTLPVWPVLAAAHRLPLTTHVHEAEPDAHPALWWALTRSVAISDRVIANSEFTRSVVATTCPRGADRAVVVPNPIRSGANTPTHPRSEIRDHVRLVYVGRISERKGVHTAIECTHLLRERGLNASLRIVGAIYPGYEWYERDVREQVQRLGLGDAVEFCGFVNDPSCIVDESDIALVPSLAPEPFGNTAVEPILRLRPVVASGHGGLTEAVAPYACARTATPGDPASFANAVADLVKHWADVRRNISADRDTAAAIHSTDTFCERLIANTALE